MIVFFIAAASLHAQVLVDKTQLNFSAQVGNTPAATQTLNVTSAASGAFFIAQTSAPWLKLSNATNPTPQTGITGVTPSVVTVTADPTGMQAGTYTGTIGFGNVTVNVSLTVASIGVFPQTAALGTYQAGSTSYPPPVTLSISGAANGFTISKAPADTWYTAAIFGTPASAVIVQFNQAVASSLTAGTTYNGTLTITPTGSSNNVPVNVPVTLTVAASPQVTATPTTLAFNWQAAGTNNQSTQAIQINSSASIPLSYGITGSGASWVTIPGNNPASLQPGTTSVTVGVNGTGLAPGTYNGSVTITVPGALFPNASTTLNIPITITVSNFPLLNVTPSALSYSYQFGSGSTNFPQAQNVTPTSTGAPNSQVQYTVSANPSGTWLTVPVGLLTSGTPFSVSVNPGTLAPQVYTGSVTMTPVANGSGQQPVTIPVTLKISNTPNIQVSTNSVVFPYQLGQTAPATQFVSVFSSSGAPLNYTATASANAPWLVLGGATTGISDQTSFTIGVNTAGAVAGTQSATVTVNATDPATGATVGTPQTIAVTYYVSTTPQLVVSPAGPVTLSALQNSQSQPVTINLASTNSTAGNQLTITNVQFNGSWLLATQPPTTTPGSLTISAVPAASMTPGTYSGSITITATGPGGVAVADSPYTVPVILQLNATTATVAPTSLTFTAQTGAAAAASQTIAVNTNGVPLPFSAVANDGGINWLSVTNATGTTNGTVTVNVDASKLTSGTYFGAVYVNVPNAGGSPFRVPVTFTVTAGAISAPTATLTFTQVSGGAAPAAQTVAVTGTPTAINFTVGTNVTNGSGWLNAVVGAGSAVSGVTPANVTVTANAGTGSNALAVGTYKGNVTITAPGASGSPITIPVVLNVVAAQTLAFSSTTPLAFNYTIGVTQTPLTQTVSLTSSGSAPFTASASTKDNGSWLSVTPVSGTATSTATPLTVSVNPAGLTAGSYTGTITVASPSSLTPLTLTVNLTVLAVTPPVLSSIKNSASYTTGAVAPGELVTIFGSNLGPADLTFGAVTNGQRATSVGGYSVLFDGVAAPIYYASAVQTAVFVPYQISGRPTTQVTVQVQGATSSSTTYNVVTSQPGIYTQNSAGTGPGSILNQDNGLNGPNNGESAGRVIQIYMTGEGETSPGGVTGATTPADGSGLKKPVLAVTASIGGVALTPQQIVYAGSAPGATNGVFQVDLQIPAGLSAGPQPIVVSVGGVASQPGVTVQVK
ncbi:MAG TPA: hypothetical protein VG456_16325 [Candidatus Sulfopaludibacter sp.]|nr:hypothetical protein [Candidatus Sulfopaludibacter sp.]